MALSHRPQVGAAPAARPFALAKLRYDFPALDASKPPAGAPVRNQLLRYILANECERELRGGRGLRTERNGES
ncbi:hypothetical protein Mal64_36360 [Pseudobythopirellula maris]|uniref:Uncharacterized protein n=1 Tax=Pseudobythopirellula maris TaxID=2527991 RepID=A0A5C5ZHU7_9BACT|nr:hypothetical protein [Pseudobythopirellula maris]TWT86806.1 hypothetical protein Mal64_36360 [Pseudobythopirellula maris]